MGRFWSRGLCLAVAVLSLLTIFGCGGGTKAVAPFVPGKITLSPAVNTSLELGGTLAFTTSVQTAAGNNINTPITFASSDTSILNVSPTGVACAGHWDTGFTTCSGGGTGAVTVTASALGATSVPTYIFVHPHVDNVTVTGILLNGLPVQEPCLSQSQSMTLEAHAFSQGTDVTSSVGPFTWTANNPTVVSLVPLVNTAYNFPTNQATALAVNPGITQIYATASGVTSSSFQQPQYSNSQGVSSPVLDFFSTCPIQTINLELGAVGTGQTSFVTSKGTTETVFATITDIMGNSSLPNTNGGVVLSKVPLTWTASHPGVIASGSSCTENCAISTPSPGSGTVTASCSPPTCNVGFPFIPPSLASPAQITACTQFFQPTAPPAFAGCQELIPSPVYASAAVSGVVTGATAATSVLAASTNCAQVPPATCATASYYLTTAKASPGNETPLPTPPNSFLFDLGGDKVFMGSEYGAQIINPTNFGTANSPFTSLGTVIGSVLAVSNNGTFAAFSDTGHTPNQVYVVNSTIATSLSSAALTIPTATAAAFSPDALKLYILGGTGGSSLYIYSTLQALQGPIALSGPASSLGFSPNSAFAFVAESAGTGSANVAAFANCANPAVAPIAPVASVNLPANPILMKVLPNVHLDGTDSYGNSIPDGVHVLVLDATGFDILTATGSAPASGTLCPQGLTFISNDPLRPAQRIELGQGSIQPGTYANFFASADGSQLYVANGSSSSIVIYNFIVGTIIGGIELLNNATPVTAQMSTDAGTILVAGSDGLLHEVSTSVGGADLVQLPFPNIPNYLNAFCTAPSPSGVPCALNVAITKP
jgi:hypothetical protein